MVGISLLNGLKVKTFQANSIDEVLEHIKNMGLWEERFYKIGKELYHIEGKNFTIRKLNRNDNENTEFDEFLPP